MTLQSLLTPSFLETAALALAQRGFLTDEHEVVTERGQLAQHPQQVEAALRGAGHAMPLRGLILEHPVLGRVGCLYNREVFEDEAAAQDAIRNWLTVNFDQT